MKKRILYLLFIPFIFSNCIDEVKLTTDDFKKKLVVEGFISNQLGPYRVYLNFSEPYTSTVILSSIAGAKVEIVDDVNNIYPLEPVSNGIYESKPNLRGLIGKSYYLKIRLPDGREYRSKPEKILPPVPIERISTAFDERSARREEAYEFDFWVRVKDPIETGNFYRWKWTHYDTISLCRNSYTRNDNGSFNYRSYCCEPCWKVETCLGCIHIASDLQNNGKFIEMQLGSYPHVSRDSFFIIAEQQSISREYYQFWQLAQSQIYNSGGIFDNAPAQIQGNLQNIKDSTEQVLGYFAAIGLVRLPIYLPRDNTFFRPRIPTPITGFQEIYLPNCQSCGGPSRTPLKPLGWRG
jgi:hypothetical protein